MKNIKYILEALIIYPIFLIIKILGINIGRKISTFLFLKIGSMFRSNKNIKKIYLMHMKISQMMKKIILLKICGPIMD